MTLSEPGHAELEERPVEEDDRVRRLRFEAADELILERRLEPPRKVKKKRRNAADPEDHIDSIDLGEDEHFLPGLEFPGSRRRRSERISSALPLRYSLVQSHSNAPALPSNARARLSRLVQFRNHILPFRRREPESTLRRMRIRQLIDAPEQVRFRGTQSRTALDERNLLL